MGLVIYTYLPTFALEINHKCLNIRHTLMVWVWLEDDLCLFFRLMWGCKVVRNWVILQAFFWGRCVFSVTTHIEKPPEASLKFHSSRNM